MNHVHATGVENRVITIVSVRASPGHADLRVNGDIGGIRPTGRRHGFDRVRHASMRTACGLITGTSRRTLDLRTGDPQLRHIDRAWASTVHTFQGRTVDHVIAAMEANHPISPRRSPSTSKSRAPATAPSSSPTTARRSRNGSKPPPGNASRRSKWWRPTKGQRRSRNAARRARRLASPDLRLPRDGMPRRTRLPSPSASSPSDRCRRARRLPVVGLLHHNLGRLG